MQQTCSSCSRRLALWLPSLVLCFVAVAAARGPESMYTVRVRAGWNLMSLPARPLDGSRASLFPTASTAAYVYDSVGGYLAQDTLGRGTGFWLHFDSEQTIMIPGVTTVKDSLHVQRGWNLVGSLSLPVGVGEVQTIPPDIFADRFMEFVQGVGYRPADTLKPGVGYWVNMSQEGLIVLGVPRSDTPCPGTPTVEYEGKVYNTVMIGSQCWLRENLDVGTRVWGWDNQTPNGTIEKYCYQNNQARCDTFGGLYQWNEAMQYTTTPGARGICPPGWHIPTVSEWELLSAAVADDGNRLKEVGQGYGDGAGTNISGFSGMLAGYGNGTGTFTALRYTTNLWASGELGTGSANCLNLDRDHDTIYHGGSFKTSGFSVRCLKD
jgi:uncharacterized protein (TIGR02145 family)